MRRITETTLKTLHTTNPKGDRIYDTVTRGFCVRVMPDGTKHFEVRYGGRRNRRRMTVGLYGKLTLKQAREKAKELLSLAELGEDPAADRKRKEEIPTFGAWKVIYASRIRGRLKSARWIGHFLETADERWKAKPLDTVKPADVEALFQKIGEKHPTMANRWLACIRPCFASAIRDGYLEANPAAGVRKLLENAPRARVLSDPEMKALLDAVAREKDVHARAALYLLVETGARLSEALRARWEDFDLEAGTWRIPSPKAGTPQVAPLSASVVAKLKRLPHAGDYVVAGRNTGKPGEPDKPRADLKGPWERVKAVAMKKAPSIADVHVHDLRRSFGLAVAKAAGLHVASKLLRHGDVRITEKVYAPLGIEELRAAVEKRSEVLPFARLKGKR